MAHVDSDRYNFIFVFVLATPTPWPESANELYRPSDRLLSAKLLPTFADRWYHAVCVTDPLRPYSRRHCFFQVAPQLYSRGWVDPVPDPLLLRKSDRAGNLTRNSGFVARNSDRNTTEEAIYFLLHNIYIQFVPLRKHNTSRLCSQELWPLYHRGGQVRVRATLRLTISQSVCLGIEPNLGQLTRVCFLLEISGGGLLSST
jgi:hypothetical protein